MKNLRKIIGKILILVIFINLAAPVALAQTKPELACEGQKPDYEKLTEEWKAATPRNQEAYEEHFEKAQEAYHHYVACMFKYAEDQILNEVEDWNKPGQACLTPDQLKVIIQGSEPTQMLAPVLDAHTAYKEHIKMLGDDFEGGAEITDKKGYKLRGVEALIALEAASDKSRRQRELEMVSSLVAIDLAFTSLKELRIALVMHVHFQCTLEYLEKYRKALRKLRRIVVPLPSQLRDASVTK